MINDCYIDTLKGGKFFLDVPLFDIEEIAHALGQKVRYNGHCRRFFSVAEHSLLVAGVMATLGLGHPFEGLLHDAHEAYLPDVPAPWKPLMPDFCKIEKALEAKLRSAFGLPVVMSAGAKQADWIARAIEAKQLMASKGKEWFYPDGIREQANKFMDIRITGYPPEIARDHFLAAFGELGGPRGFHR